MGRPLLRHPDTPDSPLREMVADAIRIWDGRVLLSFAAMGNPAQVRIPPPGPSARSDELWRTTCFEAFFAPMSGSVYYELNFSPSGAWAAYRFDGYRTGMRDAHVPQPWVESTVAGPMLALDATVSLAALPELGPLETWRFGLSAIVEAQDGGRAYWALAHGPGEPDFHHRDCFAGELAPAPRP